VLEKACSEIVNHYIDAGACATDICFEFHACGRGGTSRTLFDSFCWRSSDSPHPRSPISLREVRLHSTRRVRRLASLFCS
jgi:hypothetical protein